MASAASIMATSPRVSIIPSASPMLPPWPRPFGPCSAVAGMTLNRGGLRVKCGRPLSHGAVAARHRAEMLDPPRHLARQRALAREEGVADAVAHQLRAG